MKQYDVRTRNSDGLKIDLIRPRYEHVRKSGYYGGTVMWNDLTFDFLNNLKERLKKKIKTREILVLMKT